MKLAEKYSQWSCGAKQNNIIKQAKFKVKFFVFINSQGWARQGLCPANCLLCLAL